jgi:Uma2 family endonuclease
VVLISKGIGPWYNLTSFQKELGVTTFQANSPPAAPHPFEDVSSLADLLDRLDGIPAERVRFFPTPGTATVDDVVEIEARERRLYELVDGVLVEKPMGIRESVLASKLIGFLLAFVDPRKLGVIAGEAGMMQLRLALLRMPDVAFISWSKFPGRRVPSEPAPLLSPDLAVEIISPSNTKREMARKLREYFDAGTRLVWYVDPKPRTVEVYTRAGKPDAVLTEQDTLDGGEVLKGFALSLHDLFSVLDEQGGGPAPEAANG